MRIKIVTSTDYNLKSFYVWRPFNDYFMKNHLGEWEYITYKTTQDEHLTDDEWREKVVLQVKKEDEDKLKGDIVEYFEV